MGRGAGRTRRLAALAAAALVASVSFPGIPTASGQGASGAAVVRLSGLSGLCGTEEVSLEGSLEVSLPKGATVRSTYEVTGGGQVIDLGEESITATATTSSTVPYEDEIWFGPRWVPVFPFSYLQRTVVTVDGVDVYTQLMEATCTAAGAAAEVTLSEAYGPDTPEPPDSAAGDLGPRFVG